MPQTIKHNTLSIKAIALSVCFIVAACASSFGQYVLTGSASQQSNDCYTLTPATNFTPGALWAAEDINLAVEFDLYFNFFFGCADSGGTGFAFVLQNDTNNISLGSNMGYGGITQSIALEFDTYEDVADGDPAFDHISLMQNGVLDHSSANNLAGPVAISNISNNIEDCAFHSVHIKWTPTDTTLQVWVDCNLRLTYSADFTNNFFGGSSHVYWGMTAATTNHNNEQKLCFSYVSAQEKLQNTVICKGVTTQLDAGQGFAYNWTPVFGLSSVSSRTVNASPFTTTQYNVTITDNCGSPRYDSVVVVVEDSVVISIGGTNSICSGDSIALNFAVQGNPPFTAILNATDTFSLNALGRNPATNQPYYIQPSLTSVYSITTASNYTGCVGIGQGTLTITTTNPDSFNIQTIPVECFGTCDGQAFLTPPTGSPLISYTWPNNVTSNANTSLCGGLHNITISYGNSCQDTLSLSIYEPPSITLQPILDDTICYGNAITINAIANGGTGILNYNWVGYGVNAPTITLNPEETTPITVAVTDGNNCPAVTQTFFIYVRDPLFVNLPSKLNVCVSEPATITANPTGGDGLYAYQWTSQTGANLGNTQSITFTPGTSTNVYLQVSDACNSNLSTGRDTMQVVVGNYPVVDLSYTAIDSCFPAQVEFKINNYQSAYNYSLKFGDGDSSKFNGYLLNHGYNSVGYFDVTYTIDNGFCDTTVVLDSMIRVYRNPIADFYYNPYDITILFPSTQFFDQSDRATFWRWYIDGEEVNITPNFDFTFPDSGIYNVELYIEDTYGCSNSIVKEIPVLYDYTTWYVPNTFSPNGDGINEDFGPYINEGIALDYVFRIFDVTGSLVYESTNYADRWDGTNQRTGNPVPVGCYTFMVRYIDSLGENQRKLGAVNLLR